MRLDIVENFKRDGSVWSALKWVVGSEESSFSMKIVECRSPPTVDRRFYLRLKRLDEKTNKKANGTRYSEAVTHPRTDLARRSLTAGS